MKCLTFPTIAAGITAGFMLFAAPALAADPHHPVHHPVHHPTTTVPVHPATTAPEHPTTTEHPTTVAPVAPVIPSVETQPAVPVPVSHVPFTG